MSTLYFICSKLYLFKKSLCKLCHLESKENADLKHTSQGAAESSASAASVGPPRLLPRHGIVGGQLGSERRNISLRSQAAAVEL